MNEILRAHEADNYVYQKLTKKLLPTTLMSVAIASPQMSSARVAHAIARLVKQNVIVAQSFKSKGVTYWRIEEINPAAIWKKSKHITG
jgi:hypothetical protein